jgi:hypothetical protein
MLCGKRVTQCSVQFFNVFRFVHVLFACTLCIIDRHSVAIYNDHPQTNLLCPSWSGDAEIEAQRLTASTSPQLLSIDVVKLDPSVAIKVSSQGHPGC